ncbi:hypothetical protein QJS04_geneDACA012874 [Acorus gramineus]|uniref:Uncharacterized protein n=1 Tax=Acorus gramineus TaxID=55184 RepID=A0AAV9BGU3_ACOGR|nr:hypothetical protein QJS04_geneDACA012874 [Acorus gramineus]
MKKNFFINQLINKIKSLPNNTGVAENNGLDLDRQDPSTLLLPISSLVLPDSLRLRHGGKLIFN